MGYSSNLDNRGAPTSKAENSNRGGASKIEQKSSSQLAVPLNQDAPDPLLFSDQLHTLPSPKSFGLKFSTPPSLDLDMNMAHVSEILDASRSLKPATTKVDVHKGRVGQNASTLLRPSQISLTRQSVQARSNILTQANPREQQFPLSMHPGNVSKLGSIQSDARTEWADIDVRDNYDLKYSDKHSVGWELLQRDAPIWAVARDEMNKRDESRVQGWKNTVDVLLAGLFSAVVTAFLIQVTPSLQPDNQQTSVLLLTDIANSQRALAGWNPLTIPERDALPLDDSLVLSLTAALVCVVAKQWIFSYVSQPASTLTHYTVLVRHQRYMGLERWHMPFMMGFLPFLLIGAVFLFFGGMVVFLLDLHLGIAITVSVLSGLVTLCYILMTFLPLIDIQCPYRTPETDFLYRIIRYMKIFPISFQPPTLLFKELLTATRPRRHALQLISEVVSWLYCHSTNSSSKSVVFQSIAGFGALGLQEGDSLVIKKTIMRPSPNRLHTNFFLDLGNHLIYYSSREGTYGLELNTDTCCTVKCQRLQEALKFFLPLIHDDDAQENEMLNDIVRLMDTNEVNADLEQRLRAVIHKVRYLVKSIHVYSTINHSQEAKPNQSVEFLEDDVLHFD